MGAINLDNTGSGGAVTLTSDGTDLLLGGTAIGGAPTAYAANASGIGLAPQANGTRSVAIGSDAAAQTNDCVAIGYQATAQGTRAFAFGYDAIAGPTSPATNDALALGYQSRAYATSATAINNSYASGTASFAAAIGNNTSSYGALGANSIAIGNLARTNSGYAGAVVIGDSGFAPTTNSVSIGYGNQATGSSNAIAIGYENRAYNGPNTSSLGGKWNDASGNYATVVGGGDNNAIGNYSMVAGGSQNDAAGEYSFASGYQSKAARYGQKSHSSGRFAATGDAQGSQFILRADTTDATATVLTTDNTAPGTTDQIVAASDTCITFDGTITAMQNGAQAYASWRIEGLLVNDGGTTTLANSATTVIQNLSSWGMALTADNTNNALAITCTGEASHNIRWVANIRTTEVTYA